MAYERYAVELKDKDNNIYGIADTEARETKADAIEEEIDTEASVMTFNDGGNGFPMELNIAINPVQDTHGLDPYPAGGGKNLLKNIDITTGTGLSRGLSATQNADDGCPSNNALCSFLSISSDI